jgi:hypothetical protein
MNKIGVGMVFSLVHLTWNNDPYISFHCPPESSYQTGVALVIFSFTENEKKKS